MCMKTKCGTCKKVTWSGCGAHVDQVLAGVPKDQICKCKPAERQAGGLFSRLFGR